MCVCAPRSRATTTACNPCRTPARRSGTWRHTTWFFETFLLQPLADDYRAYHGQFEYLFNSYYNGVGEQFPRAERGNLSRPTVDEVLDYRRHVDAAMQRLFLSRNDDKLADILERTLLGLHHEQQHQELIVHRPQVQPRQTIL